MSIIIPFFAILIYVLALSPIESKQINHNEDSINLNEDTLLDDKDAQCKMTGKYKQLCIKIENEANDDLAIYQKKYDCLKDSKCLYNNDECQWIHTTISSECLKQYKPKGIRVFKTSESFKTFE